MKVEGNRPNFAPLADKADVAKTGDAKRSDAASGTTAAATDRVKVSSDAALAATAIDAAKQTPSIREAKVQRAKALLAEGKLGADASKLADKLIDGMLNR